MAHPSSLEAPFYSNFPLSNPRKEPDLYRWAVNSYVLMCVSITNESIGVQSLFSGIWNLTRKWFSLFWGSLHANKSNQRPCFLHLNGRNKKLAYTEGRMKLSQRNTKMRLPEKISGNLYSPPVPDNSSWSILVLLAFGSIINRSFINKCIIKKTNTLCFPLSKLYGL